MPWFFAHRERLLYSLLCSVILACVMAVVSPIGTAGRWITSAGLLLDIAGLLQLEVSGLLKVITDRVFDLDAKGEPLPSRYVREIIESPDEREWKKTAREWLMAGPRTAVILIGGGCALQLIGTWLP